MASPQAAIEAALYAKLVGQASLITALGGTAIFNKLGPQPAPSKFCVYQQQGGGDVNESPTRMREPLYTVKAIATTQAAAFAIDAEIDTALHNKQLTVTGWTNILCQRETDINFPEIDSGGVTRYHAGGIYRIIIDS